MPPQRRSIRLPDYDYRWPGAYFVTLVTHNRLPLFGEIRNGDMQFNAAGQMIDRWWRELPHKYPKIELDAYILMPTHLHGVIVKPFNAQSNDDVATDVALSRVMQWFKTMTSNEYIRQVKQAGWPPFEGRVWQRNYYEHVVRDEADLARIRQYIADNPAQWADDEENPHCS